MSTDRVMRAWTLISERAGDEPLTVAHVCAAAAPAVGVDGAGVTIMLDTTVREIVYGSDEIAAGLEELQLTLGQGPCVDAFDGGPVLAGDLDSADYMVRWPMFTPAAVDIGARAVFALPLQVGAIRLGVVDFYRARRGGLGRSELIDALIFTDVAVAVLLDGRAGDDADRGPPDGGRPRWSDPAMLQAIVHQATGMISVQLGVKMDVALIRLRGHAFASGRRLTEVARDVVERRLRFEPDTAPEDGS